ncbi:MAG: hypothetical protein Q9187_003908, partial [Circinaria calcarea]
MPINAHAHILGPLVNLKGQIAQQIPLHAAAIDPGLEDAQGRVQHAPPEPVRRASSLTVRARGVADPNLALVAGIEALLADEWLERGVEVVAVQEDVLGDGRGAAPEQ